MSGSLADIRAHRERSAYNEALAERYEAALPENREWSIVIRFYSALHIVQSYLATKNQRFQATLHDQRWKAIRASPELLKGGRFPAAYRSLQDVSEQVRYDPGFKPTDGNLADAKMHLGVIQSFVASKVESYIQSHTT